MNTQGIVTKVFSFISLVLFQAIFLKNFALFDYAFCFAYVAFLLWLPVNLDRGLLLILGFVLGLSVDLFYDTIGIHTASCVLLAFLRKYILNFLRPTGGYEQASEPSVKEYGYLWFVRYAYIALLPHHILLFVLSAGNQDLIFWAILKAIVSTACTTLFVSLFEQFGILYEASRRRRR